MSTSYFARFAQLAALWAYAVSQPVFSMLEANPEFLVARGSTKPEIVVFAMAVAFGPPTLAILVEYVLSLVSGMASDVLHLALVGLFALPLAMLVASQFDPMAVVALLGAAALSVLLVLVYVKWRPVRLFLALSVVLPLFGLASFLFGVELVSEDAQGADVQVREPAPVVTVVFDEFPVSSLMTRTGAIDEIRYPNFARLARRATWYPRATTVHEHTTAAVPAILTGRLPLPGELPRLADHPENLFTLLGESYQTRVREEVTYLCPKRYCPRRREPLKDRLTGLLGDVRVAFLHSILPDSLAKGLPSIEDRWSGFSNTERLLAATDRADVDAVVFAQSGSAQDAAAQFVAGFTADEPTRTLHFTHLMLPHRPWRYLPSGLNYGDGSRLDGWGDDAWGTDRWLVAQAYQRHLVQVEYTDTFVGDLLDRLERLGLYDDALIVLVADHGVSFRPGGRRRIVTDENLADMARVPLFVKLPGQRVGREDRRPVRTIDVLPTIADALGIALPWKVDGRSLSAAGGGSTRVTIPSREAGGGASAPVRSVDAKQAATITWKSSIFGEGPTSVFAIGENRELLGRRLGDLETTPAAGGVRFDHEELFRDVRRSTSFIPALVTGTVSDRVDPRTTELAVVVNGRISALTRVFAEDGRRFTALVPESAFRPGPNRLQLLVATREEDGLRLQLLRASTR